MRDGGAYLLVLHLARRRRRRIGSLGMLDFPGGYYVYVGSARRGLGARIARHERLRKKMRWHIDYLRPAADSLVSIPVRTRRDRECAIARKVRAIADDVTPRFGSSDCSCGSHLFYFSLDPLRREDFRTIR